MGSELEFGPDTDTIRQWLEKRHTYKEDAGRHRDDTAAEAAHAAVASETPLTARQDSTSAGRAVLEGIGSIPPPTDGDSHRVGRSILEGLGTTPTPPAPEQPAAAAPTPISELQVTAASAVPGRSTDQTFAPRSATRRVLSIVFLLVLASTAFAGWRAYEERTSTWYVIAGVAGVLTLVVWAIRSTTTTSEVEIRRGELRISRGGTIEVVDIANPFTPVALLGEPGHRNWRVLVERPGRPLLHVDGTMVDAQEFTELLLRLRKDLQPVPGYRKVLMTPNAI